MRSRYLPLALAILLAGGLALANRDVHWEARATAPSAAPLEGDFPSGESATDADSEGRPRFDPDTGIYLGS